MFDPQRLIFIHGLEGTSQGAKATLLRGLYPQMRIPDFCGPLEARMAALYLELGTSEAWTVVGSSFGGLMGAIFTLKHPNQVRKLILMAPALVWPDFSAWVEGPAAPQPVSTPVIVYHGIHDEIVPLAPVYALARRVFQNLVFNTVDDDHGLYQTAQKIDWPSLLN